MKMTLLSCILVMFSLLCFHSNSYALPIDGDQVTFSNGNYYTGYGGEFLLKGTNLNDPYSFISFSVERNEYAILGSTYTIESIEDFAKNGGVGRDPQSPPGKDYISDTTKWLLNEYIFNYGAIWDGRNKNEFAGLMQATIWFLETEITSISDAYLLHYYQTQTGSIDYYTPYSSGYLANVQVVNLVDQSGNYMESQIIALDSPSNTVPEPATLLLFGVGLAGLSFFRRVKK